MAASYITRVDQESTRTHGWVARLGHRKVKAGYRPRFSAFFGDKTNGGRKRARTAAGHWVKFVLKHGRPPKRPIVIR